jgi:hypothetical protein
MALMNEYPVFTQELGQGLQEGFASMTPFNSALQNNGARNPLGAVYFRPSPSQGGGLTPGGGLLGTSTGYGSGLWMKYVLYKSTANPAVVAGPAPVYWADETFTIVTGKFSEGVVASNATSIAGWLLPNSGTVAGIGAGTTLFTATLLNNGGNGSFVWIGLSGFIPSASLVSGSAGSFVFGGADFAVGTAISDGSNITHRGAGYIIGTVTSSIGDIIATVDVF